MKTIGLLGGITWHSTAVYYDLINRGVADRLGPYRSASLVLHSIDYGEVRRARADGDWHRLERLLVRACRGLKRAGADGLVLCSNTIHRFAPQIEAETGLEVLHVADAVVQRAKSEDMTCVGLLGTAYTTTASFYRERLESGGLQVLVMEEQVIERLDQILLEEVASGQLLTSSRSDFVDAVRTLHRRGAQAVVLGCTEIGLLIGDPDTAVPMLETVALHADYAVRWALEASGEVPISSPSE